MPENTVALYLGEELVSESADHSDFVQRLAEAAAAGDLRPFVLVRRNEDRLLVATQEGRMLLSFLFSDGEQRVSAGASYAEGNVEFQGIRSRCTTAVEHFVEPQFALAAIGAFFRGDKISDEVDLHPGLPDPSLPEFPEPLPEQPRPAPRVRVRRAVEIPQTLAADMEEVCLYIDDVGSDPGVSIDFDDAIQIGDLCGGRGEKSEQFAFSYYSGAGETWLLELSRGEMDGIAAGTLGQLTIEVLTATPAPGDLRIEEHGHAWNLPDLTLEVACEKLRALGIRAIEPSSTREEVVACMGKPTHTGGGQRLPGIGYIHPFVKYHLPQCQVRFEFEESGSMRGISFLPPDWEPGK